MTRQTTADGKNSVGGWALRVLVAAGRRRWATMVAVTLVGGITAVIVGSVFDGQLLGLHWEGGRITTIQDFASHTEFTRAVWTGELRQVPGSIYGVAAHLRFMQGWAGEPTERALPFGYSPTMLWVLGPFSAMPLPVAYVLWSLVGLAATIWVVLHRRMHRLVAAMVYLTPVAVASVALGQTAILSTAGFLYLMNRTLMVRTGRQSREGIGWLTAVVVLWALGAKPPLGLTAAAALLALRNVRTVVAALVLTVVTTLALAPWIGVVSWPAGYLSLLSTYNLTQANPAFAWSLAPALMTNLRALLSVDLGVTDGAAALVSNVAWAAALVAVVWAGRTRKVTAEGVWAIALLSYLLLCSHVSFTEDVLLLLVPAVLVPWKTAPHVRWALAVWLIVPIGLLLGPALGPVAGVRPPPLLFIKLVMLAWTIYVTSVGARAGSSADGTVPVDNALPSSEPAT